MIIHNKNVIAYSIHNNSFIIYTESREYINILFKWCGNVGLIYAEIINNFERKCSVNMIFFYIQVYFLWVSDFTTLWCKLSQAKQGLLFFTRLLTLYFIQLRSHVQFLHGIEWRRKDVPRRVFKLFYVQATPPNFKLITK